MIRTALSAVAALLFATQVHAQSQQELLDQKYDRALASGYKALFLCSAISHAENNGTTRATEHVMQWELSGIQPPLDEIVPDLPFTINRTEGGSLTSVAVTWADDMAPRLAVAGLTEGCALQPIGGLGNGDELLITADGPEPIYWGFADHTLDSQTKSLIFSRAFGQDYGQSARTTAVVIAKDGKIIAEDYAKGFNAKTPQRTWSVAKSLAATIVGMAVHSEYLDVYSSAGLGVSDDDPRRAITIDHLLRMASGRYTDTPGNRSNPLYYGGAVVDERATTWPLINPPGSVFRYSNSDTLIAIHALESRVSSSFFSLGAQREIGMFHSVIEADWQMNPLLSSQVWATARDLARLGQLHLDDGVLPEDERILPEGWVEYVSSPSGPQPEGRGLGYGAGWWLFNESEGIPRDTFAAMGNRGQYIVVVPSMDVVIVRRGEDPTGSRFDIVAFTKDVLAALKN
jgi:CubicO group peptidase (beta-lactamase class C family)